MIVLKNTFIRRAIMRDHTRNDPVHSHQHQGANPDRDNKQPGQAGGNPAPGKDKNPRENQPQNPSHQNTPQESDR